MNALSLEKSRRKCECSEKNDRGTRLSESPIPRIKFWGIDSTGFGHGVLDESRSFFRVHTGYFSNIPKCIKAEFIASWACSQSSVVSSSQR
ncbi:hypothetical protein TNCV_2150791 [Trichonephila clavipes]|nr:hypothetical protein TNCV_2150791 [Trichonephila clavipes]